MAEEDTDYVCQHSGAVTWAHRVDNPEVYDWCVVPETAFDVLFVPGIAVILACLLQNRVSTTLVLIIGGILQGLMFPLNLGRFGNSIAIWLGIQPYELFFYIFLPPLLFDAAVRIDFYLFKKVLVQVVSLAFLVVVGSVGLMMPIMLYVFNLHASHWTWQYVGLFVSMLASTDAVAIISTMKTNGGPSRLRTTLEGESLLNDASGITLFTIFLQKVEQVIQGHPTHDTFWSVFGNIVGRTAWLAFGGFLFGIAFGIVTLYILRYMRNRGAGVDQQVGLTFAMAYMSYYIASAPAGVSGVISVAVFGLFGAATSRWDMSIEEESEAFEKFWDTLSFVANTVVFFFSGMACVNFAVRSSQNLDREGQSAVLASTIWRFPLIYLVMFAVRFMFILLFSPVFRLLKSKITMMEIVFATVAGLRGSVSLIMAQGLITDHDASTQNLDFNAPEEIKAEIVLWTAGFVLMTLVINASILPWLLRVTGLSKVANGKIKQRKRAVRALQNHTANTIQALKEDDDEMLRGVDWKAVESFAEAGEDYEHFKDPCKPPPATFHWYWPLSWHHARHRPFNAYFSKRKQLKGKRGSGFGHSFGSGDTIKLFGRKNHGQPEVQPDDLESGLSGLSLMSPRGTGLTDTSNQPDKRSGDSDDDSDPDNLEDMEMPYLGRSSVQQARPSTDARARPTIDLAKPSVKEDSGPPQRRRPSTNWLRTTSARLLGGGAGAVDRQFQEGPLPLSKQDLPPPQESDEKFAAPPALQSPFSASEKQPEASCSSGTETGSTSQADRAGSTEMVQLDMQSAPPTDARQSWADHAATSTLAPVQGPPNVKAASSPPKTPEPVAGSMATVTHDTQDLPHNTHVVRVRGVLLPMPQPDSLEDLPSPSVTPESSTLMRMANSLSRQQPGGMRVRGTALANLASAPDQPTWPRSVNDSATSRRPPLPFRPQSSLGGGDSPEQLSIGRSEQRSVGRTDSGLANELRNQLSRGLAGSGNSEKKGGLKGEARPSLFGAFPELRQAPQAGSRHAEKHRELLNAFQNVERDSAMPRSALRGSRDLPRQSVMREGSGPEAMLDNERTWTAGMTKGKAPAELQQQLALLRELKRTRSVGTLDDAEPPSEDPAAAAEDLEGSTSSASHSRNRAVDQDSAKESDRFKSKISGSSMGPPSSGFAHSLQQLHAAPLADAVHMNKVPLTEDELAEARVRLVVGFKRYFHGKRIEGLLSSRGLRIVDAACDASLEHAERELRLWDIIDNDASGRFIVGILAHQMFLWRRAVLHLRQRRPNGWKGWEWFRRQLAWPLTQLIRLVHWRLSKLMLLGIEVAIEYMLALLHSPQVQLLRHHDALGVLQEEIRSELEEVWSFIVEREVEAPERFQAIQSYRASMAVLRQQRLFIKQLFESGVVEDAERDELNRPVEEKERHLTQKGPVWKAPSFIQVLRSIPFLRHTPQRIVESLYRHGRLKMYSSQATIRQSTSEDGIFIVGSGLVRVTYQDMADSSHEYYLGTGGVYGLYTALTGCVLPGHVQAVAQGNALGKGPLVFELYQSGIRTIRKQAAAGVEAFEQIEVDMFRMTALYILERLKPSLMAHLLLCFSPMLRRQSSNAPAPAPAPKLTLQRTMQRTNTLTRLDLPEYDNDSDTESPRRTVSSSLLSNSAPDLDSQQAAEEQLQSRVLAAYEQLTQDMTTAQLLPVPAGAPYLHMSSAVLLRGSLRVKGQAFDATAPPAASGKKQSITYHAPFVLPWITPDGDDDISATRFIALENTGASSSHLEDEDVLLMVRPHDRFHLTRDALQAHARTLDDETEGETDRVADLPRTLSGHRVSDAAMRRVSKGMRHLARASRTFARPLALEPADKTEFVPPALKGGAPQEWWNHIQRRSVVPHRPTLDLAQGRTSVDRADEHRRSTR